MNKKELIKKIRRHIFENHGTSKEYAKHHEVSPQYISRVLNGSANVPDYILDDIGVIKNTFNQYVSK